MAKYRRKSMEVEAVQFHSSAQESEWPAGIVRDRDGYTVLRSPNGRGERQIIDGDWIVTEASGKQRVMGPEEFAAKYEEA